MAKYPFLSPEWMEAAKRIRDEHRGRMPSSVQPMKMNQVVTDVPFGSGTLHTHLDSGSGGLEMDLGHLDNPDLTITLDYETAKAVFVDGNPQAGLQAFMAGRIKVDGDVSRLLALQGGVAVTGTAGGPGAAGGAGAGPAALELARQIRDITAD